MHTICQYKYIPGFLFTSLFYFVSHFCRWKVSTSVNFSLISYTHPFGSYPSVHSSGMSFKIWYEAHEWTGKKRKSEKRWNIKRKWKLFYSFIQLKIVLWNKIHEPKSWGKEEVATHKKKYWILCKYWGSWVGETWKIWW